MQALAAPCRQGTTVSQRNDCIDQTPQGGGTKDVGAKQEGLTTRLMSLYWSTPVERGPADAPPSFFSERR
jgi:hypothetical protein